MILLGNFYTLENLSREEQVIKADIRFNQAHAIFDGHFPGQPVVPGVCMMQIIKETLETELGKKMDLLHADQAKFLTMIDPRIQQTVTLHISYKNSTDAAYDVVASLYHADTIFFKYKAVFS